MQKLNFSDAPHDWAICFQTTCPQAATCLRRRMAELAPETLLRHISVLPAALRQGQCSLYVPAEPVHMAWGMKNTFARVKPYHYQEMRPKLEGHFGSHSTFYRYFNGQRPITPAQQQWIANLLRQFGYDAPPHFDREEDVYDFTS